MNNQVEATALRVRAERLSAEKEAVARAASEEKRHSAELEHIIESARTLEAVRASSRTPSPAVGEPVSDAQAPETIASREPDTAVSTLSESACEDP